MLPSMGSVTNYALSWDANLKTIQQCQLEAHRESRTLALPPNVTSSPTPTPTPTLTPNPNPTPNQAIAALAVALRERCEREGRPCVAVSRASPRWPGCQRGLRG